MNRTLELKDARTVGAECFIRRESITGRLVELHRRATAACWVQGREFAGLVIRDNGHVNSSRTRKARPT